MKISLNILERILLMGILPAEDNIVTIRVVRKLKEDIGFSEEELIKWNIKSVLNENKQNVLTWNAEKTNENKEIDFGLKGIEIISEVLKDLSKKKKITEQHLSLYDKFVEE